MSYFVQADEKKNDSGITFLCPVKSEIDRWQPDGEPDIAKGEDLFLLINGGAEIYYEYGFKQTVFQSYINPQGQRINLEIYEMDSPESAYGMYTFKTGNSGAPIEVGHAGWLESYFLNFWKGNFLVTVIGLDTDTLTMNGIEKIATAVDTKLESGLIPPQIISFLHKENLQVNGITYLKGNLALYNQDIFGPKDIFGLKEGVIGKYENYSIIIFQYGDIYESKKWFKTAKNHLKQSDHFYDFVDEDNKFKFKNIKQDKFLSKQYQKWIIIILGKDNIELNNILGSTQARLK
jgi:hypothetical protein